MFASTLLTLVALGAAAPQAPQDDRWTPFEGCWAPIAGESTSVPPHLLCVQQTDGGTAFYSYVNGALDSERLLLADGTSRTVTESGCTGTESARWSTDQRRVFVQSELNCAGAHRSAGSVLAFVSSNSFVDVQTIRVGDETAVRSIRYRAVASTEYPAGFQLESGRELARETARLHAAAALDPEDVVEASRALPAEGVNALLAARRAGFELNGALLQRLAQSGVPASTIDVMVALTYPDRFALAAEEPTEERARWQPTRGFPDPYWDRYDWNRWGMSRYAYYNYNCFDLSYYTSLGCDPRWGGYGWYYGTGPVYVYPVNPGSGSGDVERSGTVSSDGYTRGTSTTKGTAQPRTRTRSADPQPRSSVGSSGTSSTGRASGGSSSGSGTVSSGGHSSGSGSTSKGTAKPRGGGEGGQ